MVRDTIRATVVATILVAAAGCAQRRAPGIALHEVAPERVATAPQPACHGCATLPMTAELASAIEARVADLKARGGDCAVYGAVLEEALDRGRITVRPYMWRVAGNLASAEGESSGGMTLARDIDSLNTGVRGLDDVLRSAEHEAAHMAFRIASGDEVREARVNERVNSCGGTPRR